MNHNLKNILIGSVVGSALIAFAAVDFRFMIQDKANTYRQLAKILAQESDRHGNNNGKLELVEIQEMYRRMGIDPKALTMDFYQRLVTSGDPTAKDKPPDFRFPTQSDLERGILSYQREK